ncbi:hypothetical protein ACLMJK_002062 [Lecanora helva]
MGILSSIFSFLFFSLWLTPAFGGLFHCHGGGDIPGQCRHKFFHWNQCKPERGLTKTEGISKELLDQFRLMSQYAAAAYWPGNNNSTGTPLSCSGPNCHNDPDGNCPLVEQAKASTTDEFQDTPKFDDHGKLTAPLWRMNLIPVKGFIAIDPTNKLVVLSFRGTHSRINWFEDFKLKLRCFDLCDKCAVHTGFSESWLEIREAVISNLIAALATNPDYRVIVTGHSLGAALATLAAGDLRKQSEDLKNRTELYTFGGPRVGDVETVDFLTKQSNKTYRITNNADIIPQVPGPIIGYMHLSPEHYIFRNKDDPKPEDVAVLTGYYNREGNTGADDGFGSMDDHRHYFGYITKCDPDPPRNLVPPPNKAI